MRRKEKKKRKKGKREKEKKGEKKRRKKEKKEKKKQKKEKRNGTQMDPARHKWTHVVPSVVLQSELEFLAVLAI